MTAPQRPWWATVAGLPARVRSLYRGLFNRNETEAGIREEFAHHIAMRTDALIAQGVAPALAAKQARVEFGHIESHRHDARESRGLRWFDQMRFSWIDIKLGLRMLVKHPLLSLAAVFALAVGIPIGLAPSHVARAVLAPLPGDTENRVRAIRFWDPVTLGVANTQYEDFRYWSRELKSFSALAAFRTTTFAVGTTGERPEPVVGAQLSARAFEIIGTAPHVGRALSPADAERGAPDVVVLGYDVWQSKFGADPGIIGRTIRVGHMLPTVVGVMREGFRFPSYGQLWVPLKSESLANDGASVRVQIVGRLASGVSAQQAQAELSAIALPTLASTEDAERRARLRPEVVSFGLLFMGLPSGGLHAVPEFFLVRVLMFVLLLVACGNVAMLVFARTATRFKEIAIRTALGASRMRIITQMFAETLVVAILAAGIGVFVIDRTLKTVNLAALAGESAMPYWLSIGVTPTTMVSALVLAAISATVAGVVPAIRITGRAVYQNMRGQSGIRFGKLTSMLIVADIAVAIAAVGLSLAIVKQSMSLTQNQQAAGIPAAEFLSVEFRILDDEFTAFGRDRTGFAERVAASQRALVAALEAEPGVQGVAVANVLPLMEHPSRPLEIFGADAAANASSTWVRTATVNVDFFRALGHTTLSGRDFLESDTDGATRYVIVNTPFVERHFGGRDPIGQRIRFPQNNGGTANDWFEIVGVVPHVGVNMVNASRGDAVYVPAKPGQLNPVTLGIHLSVPPMQFVPRVRELATAASQDLIMGDVTVLSEVRQGDWYLTLGVGVAMTLLAAVLVALAASGMFAMLSLSVTERTREIGIRAALGASKRSLVTTILRRSLMQIGGGALIGIPIAARLVYDIGNNNGTLWSLLGSIATATAMAVGIVGTVGLFACLVPTRRVLAVDASEAMRAEG